MYTQLLNSFHTNPLNNIFIHFHKPNHSLSNLYIQGVSLSNNNNNLHSKHLSWIKKLKTFIPPGVDTHFKRPYFIRLSVPFSKSNALFCNHIKTLVHDKFLVNINVNFSTYPNFKKLLCRSKV